MTKFLLTSVLVAMMAAASVTASGCSDSPADALIGGGDGTSGGAGSSGSSGGDPLGGSSGTNATSGGLAPAPPPADPAASVVTPPPAGACVPPNVQAMLAARCTGCHSSPPVNGSLSALVTLADLLAASKEDPTKNEAQLSLARMQNAASPMPPGALPPASDVAALQTWISAQYTSSACVAGPAPPPPPATDVFTGAPAFVSKVAGDSHNAGKNCMSGCHDHGFTFAGTVTNGAGLGVAGAEVRLVDANNKAISVYTGRTGNFHSSTSFAAPAKIGVRNAASKNIMLTALSAANGGCASCHVNGGTTTPIHLP